ncbi:MAG: ROK family transcriptional regulator [Bauldia sp.]|nr:MAG: ROK family transcriptional regulator [Bauldia sp.]
MKTADPELMRAINRFHVMDAIRRSGPISRVEISDRTELSPTTVSAITALLLDDGLIVPRQMGAVRDTARGRPRVMLELNPDAAFVAGVKLAPDQITVAVNNFRADVLKSLSLPIRIDRQPASVTIDLVEDGVRRCVADAGLAIKEINGGCVGLPGVVERSSGRCRQSPIFRERDVPLGPALTERLGIPVTVDSDVNLVTLAEHWFGHGRGLDSFLVVSIEHSLGLGIMHDGELFRGANGLGPDLGDLLVLHPGADGHNTPDRLAAIVATAADGNGFAAGGRANGLPVEVYRTVGGALGFTIANLITLFAPPKVILAGGALAIGDALLGPLRDAVAEYTPPSLADVAEIVVHDWGDDIWARGAAAMTLRDLYGAPWNTTGPVRHG